MAAADQASMRGHCCSRKRRVNVQLGGGAVSVDADNSAGGWAACSGGADDGGADGGSADGSDSTALRGWRGTALLALAMAAAAACIWALVESVLSTKSSAARFWDVIDDAKQQAGFWPALGSGFGFGRGLGQRAPRQLCQKQPDADTRLHGAT